MKAKKYIVAAIILNTVLLAFAASIYQHRAGETRRVADPKTDSTASSGKFGAIVDTVVPAAKEDGTADLMDLETGLTLLHPPLEFFNFRAGTIMGWIRSNGLDISCFLWPGGAACITYDMAVIPVDAKCWEQTREEELVANPALYPVRNSPRKLLVLGQNRPDTYIFRTAEGTFGILHIVGFGEQERGVKIRYKMINSGSCYLSAAAPGK